VETAAFILDVRVLVVRGNSQSSIEAAFATCPGPRKHADLRSPEPSPTIAGG
jgi:hypothetical protein